MSIHAQEVKLEYVTILLNSVYVFKAETKIQSKNSCVNKNPEKASIPNPKST